MWARPSAKRLEMLRQAPQERDHCLDVCRCRAGCSGPLHRRNWNCSSCSAAGYHVCHKQGTCGPRCGQGSPYSPYLAWAPVPTGAPIADCMPRLRLAGTISKWLDGHDEEQLFWSEQANVLNRQEGGAFQPKCSCSRRRHTRITAVSVYTQRTLLSQGLHPAVNGLVL